MATESNNTKPDEDTQRYACLRCRCICDVRLRNPGMHPYTPIDHNTCTNALELYLFCKHNLNLRNYGLTPQTQLESRAS